MCKKALDGRQRVFCSKDCANKDAYRRESKARLDAKLARLEAAGALDVMCRHCLKDFRPNWAKSGPVPKFCSIRCRTRHAEDRQSNRASRGALKVCANCAHATATGCGLEVYRACWPGTFARHWEAREAVSA